MYAERRTAHWHSEDIGIAPTVAALTFPAIRRDVPVVAAAQILFILPRAATLTPPSTTYAKAPKNTDEPKLVPTGSVATVAAVIPQP